MNNPPPKEKKEKEKSTIRDEIEPNRVEFEDFKTGLFMSRA
jgi:hypothetical protein